MSATEPLSENALLLSRAVKDPLSKSIFRLLSAEIHHAILDHLPKDSLTKVARTCTYFRDIALPLIYHTIDMSAHNFRELIHNTYREKLHTEQFLFSEQIFRKPEYGQYVKSLTWKVHLNRDFSPYGNQTVEKAFEMFRILEKAIYVNVQMHEIHRGYSVRVPPLFPKAKQVVLNGEVPYHLSLSILHGLANTDHLRLSVVDSLEEKSLAPGSTIVSGFGSEDEIPSGLKLFEQTWPHYARLFRTATPDEPPLMTNRMSGKRFVRLYMIKQEHGTSPATDSLPKSNDAQSKYTIFVELTSPKILLTVNCEPYSTPPTTDATSATPSQSESQSINPEPPKDKGPPEIILHFSNSLLPWDHADFPLIDPSLLLTQKGAMIPFLTIGEALVPFWNFDRGYGEYLRLLRAFAVPLGRA